MKREYLMSFRTSDYENTIIKSKAASLNTSVSAYVRSAALDKELIHIDGLREYIPRLNQIGNNLNQISLLLRMGKIRNPNFEQISQDFSALISSIHTTLRG